MEEYFYLIVAGIVLPPLLIAVYRGLSSIALFVIFILSAFVAPPIIFFVLLVGAYSGASNGPYTLSILVMSIPYALALLWGSEETD